MDTLPPWSGRAVTVTRADDEDSEAGNGVRNGSLRRLPPPWACSRMDRRCGSDLIDPHFLQSECDPIPL
eukprot:SAG25_NODE_1256_length_3486_cov_8.791911_4_plen_69_part_00